MRSFVVIKWVFVVCLFVSGCGVGDYESELSGQYKSPDKMNLVSLVKYNYGATVPYIYRVFVHSKHQNPLVIDNELDVLRIDSNDGLKIEWHGNDLVSINCIMGSVYKYTSIGQVGENRLRIDLNTNC